MTNIKDRQVFGRDVAFNRWGPVTGIVFVVFTVLSIIIANTPGPDASGTKVIEYYSKHQGVVFASAAAAVVGAVLGLLFFGYVHAWLRRIDRGWLPTVWLVGSGVFVVAVLIGGGSGFMLLDQAKHITPDTARALNAVSSELFGPIAAAGVAAALIALAASIWSHRSAARGYAIGGMIVAVAAVVLFFAPVGAIAFVLWTLVFSIRLLVRRESVAPPGTDITV